MSQRVILQEEKKCQMKKKNQSHGTSHAQLTYRILPGQFSGGEIRVINGDGPQRRRVLSICPDGDFKFGRLERTAKDVGIEEKEKDQLRDHLALYAQYRVVLAWPGCV